MLKHLLCCLLAFAGLSVQAQAPAFTLTQTLGTPVYTPRDVALDPAGNIYLLDREGITKLNPRAELIHTLRPAGYTGGLALGVDGAGNCYVANPSRNRVEKYDPAGTLLAQFGTAVTGPGQFQSLSSLAVDPAGNCYTTDTGLDRVQKFGPTGTLLWTYTGAGGPGLRNPRDVAIDASGQVYVYEESFRVSRLSAAGVLQQSLILPAAQVSYDEPTALAVDPAGNFFTSSFRGRAVLKFNAAGTLLATIGGGAFDGTHTPLAVDAVGHLYGTNHDHHGSSKLLKYDGAGALLGRWGNLATLGPLAMDGAGNYYYFNPSLRQLGKYSAAHQLLTQFGGSTPATGQLLHLYALAVDPDDNVYVLQGTLTGASVILKFAADGRYLTQFTALGGNITYVSSSTMGLAADATGTMYVTDYYGGCIRRIGPQGQLLPPIGTWGTGAGQLWLPQAVAVDARGFVYATDNGGDRVQRFTPSGQLVREYGTRANINNSVTVSNVYMAVDGAGNAYVSSTLAQGLLVYNGSTGVKTVLPHIPAGYVAINPRGSRLVTITSDLIRFFASGTVRGENLITGLVYDDRNGNCVRDAGEPPLPHAAVVAQPGNYYGLTDARGQYAIAVDTGAYAVELLLPAPVPGRSVTAPCAPAAPRLHFAGYGTSRPGPDFGCAVSVAPYLSVSVGSNRRRRCARNTTTVAYANTGFAPVASAQVRVTLPQHVAFLSASVPHTRDPQGDFVFDVGPLAPAAGGTIVIVDSVECGNPDIRGLTVCTRASISPANAYPPPTGWNQAAVQVHGRAQAGNQVRFVLRNAGAGSMSDSLHLRLYQNSELALQQRYHLGAGDSLVLRVPATRAVLRLEADQPAGHPTQRTASSTVEVAGLATPGQVNPSMLTQPPNAPGPETAEDCRPIVDSYDPNDKQVVPTGVTAQHYTPTGMPLRYQVRFENTGSDDAYRVEVVDTLAAGLDLRTLHVGAASHPYRLTVTGQSRPVLTFTFNNINLPPTSRDPVGSNGFVQFSIQPHAGLAPRALITNEADIFFDYNPPVRTNATVNRIYDVPPAVVPAVALSYLAVLASPVLTQLAPAQGRAGTLVTLTGQRFAAAAAANTVRFNGVSTPVLSATATTLTVRVPAAATSGAVVVSTADGAGRSAAAFTVYQPPTLTAVTPAEGVPGSTVTLTGGNYAALAAQDTVWFNATPAVVQQATTTALTVQVPAGATTGKVRIHTLGGAVTSAQDFTVWYPPTILSFSPAKGKAGDVVTLTGSNFAQAARTAVSFGPGATPVLPAATTTTLQVRVPAAAQSGPIQIQTPGGATVSAGTFTFLPAPVITSLTPAQASVGEEVQLTGVNFLVEGLPDTISFSGARAAVLAATATSATVRVPKGAFSGPLTIGGVGGRSTSARPFTLLALSAEEAVVVYPNPSQGNVTLDWQRADFTLGQAEVFNALGQLIYRENLGQASSTRLELPFLPGQTGLFLLIIQTSRGPVLKRITRF